MHTKKLRNKKYYDEKTDEWDIKIGDLVLFKKQTKDHKFDNVYEGPYKVLNASDSYVEVKKKGKLTKIHKNLLKKVQANHEE